MDDEIDLRQYFAVLWRWRYTIAAVAIASAIAAGVFSSLVPPVYEARAMVLVTKPSIQVGSVPSDVNPGLKIGAVLVSDLPTETLVAFAKSPSVLQSVEKRMIGDSRSSAAPGMTFSAQSIRNTNLVEFRVRGRDPGLAAKAANEWAGVVASQSEALFSTEARQSFAFFSSRMREANQQLGTAESSLRDFNASSQIALLQARVSAVTQQISSYQSRLVDLSVAFERSEAELFQTEAQLRNQPKSLTLSKSITTDPFLHRAASDATQRDFVELSKLQLRSEELNPVFINLTQTRANLVVQVAALRAERDRIVKALAQLTGDLERLRREFATQQLLQSQSTRAVENAKQVYEVLLQRREEARVASVSQIGSARLASPAIVPEIPIGPRKAVNIVLGTLLGLMAGVIVSFVLEYLNTQGRTAVSAQPVSASSEVPISVAGSNK